MGHIPSLPICPEESIQRFTDNLTFKKVLAKSTMYTTVLTELEGEGLVVCKIRYDDFKDQMKNNMVEIDQSARAVKRVKEVVATRLHPNLLPIEHFISLPEGATFAIRQYVKHNLRERLTQVPKIEIIQKKWITFQLLNALQQLQNLEFFHGNITPDNILIDSLDWVFLTDMLFFRESYLIEDDHKINNAFYGDFINKGR